MSDAVPFLLTTEYRRFAEFCDACRHYRYIGLCHGPPGVGKTLSARRYAGWDRIEALSFAWKADDEALATCADAETVFYTPEIVNTPRSVETGVTRLCTHLRAIREEPANRAEKVAIIAKAQEDRVRREEIMLEMDWFSPRPAEDPPAVLPEYPPPVRQPPLAPARLIVVDEADRSRFPASSSCATCSIAARAG